jgi:hypothetical protein
MNPVPDSNFGSLSSGREYRCAQCGLYRHHPTPDNLPGAAPGTPVVVIDPDITFIVVRRGADDEPVVEIVQPELILSSNLVKQELIGSRENCYPAAIQNWRLTN